MLTQSFADAVVEAEKIITGAAHVQTEQDNVSNLNRQQGDQ